MAAFDLEEQETFDEIKAWWRQYGRWVIAAAVVLVLAVGGGYGWRYWQTQQQVAAGDLYFELEAAFDGRDTLRVRELADQLVADHAGAAYTARAQVLAARRDLEAGRLEEAESRLRWVIERAKEPMLRDVARLRLAALLLDERKHEDALKWVETPELPTNSRLFDDRRGDILVGLGRNDEARAAFQAAHSASKQDTAFQAWVQLKLDALAEGEAP